MGFVGYSMQSLSRLGRTSMRRFSFELGAALGLGLATAIGVTWLHVRAAPFDSAFVMARGTPIVDQLEQPQWCSIVSESRGATGVLSRRVANMDRAVVFEIVEANRSAAHLPRAPRWSSIHAPTQAPADAGPIFEQAHGWPAAMLYRAEQLEAGGWDHAERSDAAISWSLLPAGALVNVGFYAVVWLFVIRLPGSLRRTQRWFMARRAPRAVSAA